MSHAPSRARTTRHRRGGRARRRAGGVLRTARRHDTASDARPGRRAGPGGDGRPHEAAHARRTASRCGRRQISDARAAERAQDRRRRAARAAARRRHPPGPLGRRERSGRQDRDGGARRRACSPRARRIAPRCRSPIRRRFSAFSSTPAADGSRATSRCTRRPRSSTARWRCSPTSRCDPAFPAADLERVRKVRLTSLQQLRDRAPAIADRAFASAVFGEQHPYGRPLAGTEAITRGDHARRGAALLRDVLPAEQRDAARRRRRAGRTTWSAAPASCSAAGQRGTVPTPATSTAERREGHDGRARRQAGRGAVVVPARRRRRAALDERLLPAAGDEHDPRRVVHEPTQSEPARDARLHVRRGSGFGLRRSAGPFTASAEVVTAKTDSALIEFMKELRAIRDTVPTDELAKAKRYLQLGLPSSFETTGASRPVPAADHVRHPARLLRLGGPAVSAR